MKNRKTAVAALSIASNATLIVIKIISGWLSGSVSVISEAIHSGVDLLAALIAFFSVQTSGKPADAEHPFGHGKIENISGTIEALLIFLAAGWIVYEAIHKLVSPVPLDKVGWGMAVMAISAVVNMLVAHMLFKVGKAEDSMALQADAWHLRTDVWTSVGVAAGLGVIMLGEKLFPQGDWHWIDPLAAIAVAILIIRAAFQLTIQAGKDLLDASLTPKEKAGIREAVLSYCPPLCGFHRLRTRKSGHIRFVEFHILVDGTMSVDESHHLANLITDKIREKFPETSITIHVEPCNGFCSPICVEGCLLEEKERMARHQKHQHQPG